MNPSTAQAPATSAPPRGTAGGHCTVCGAAISRAKLMCLPHWCMVPDVEQIAVSNAWRGYNAAKDPHKKLAAAVRHQKASDAATAAVNAALAAGRGARR